jgi:hypothetical protein
MKKIWVLPFAASAMFVGKAMAHHLDDYDARIRKEADLPASWFACKTDDSCVLVSVPCQSGLAVTADHGAEAQEVLNEKYFFCLGSAADDTVASCVAHRCATEPKKK